MDQDIRRTLEKIDTRITRLTRLKKLLLAEFEADEARADLPGNSERKTRRSQLIEFLETHGPSTRAQILQGTSFPKGTIAYLLNQDEFQRAPDGRWSLKKQKGGEKE